MVAFSGFCCAETGENGSTAKKQKINSKYFMDETRWTNRKRPARSTARVSNPFHDLLGRTTLGENARHHHCRQRQWKSHQYRERAEYLRRWKNARRGKCCQ